jgi:hypothetical protein
MLAVLVIALGLWPLNLLALRETYRQRAIFHAKESTRLQVRAQLEVYGQPPHLLELIRENMVYHSALAHKYRQAVTSPWKGVAPDPTPPEEPAPVPYQIPTIPMRLLRADEYVIVDGSGVVTRSPQSGSIDPIAK